MCVYICVCVCVYTHILYTLCIYVYIRKYIIESYIMECDTMEHYSAVKKNEVMPSAATRMGLEITMLSELSGRERQIYDIAYMQNLKI